MPTKRLTKVPFESIVVDPSFNGRTDYTGIDELKTSIMESGLLQPVGVTPQKGQNNTETYYLVYGFRRMMAITKIKEELGADAFAEVDVVVNEGTLEELRDRNVKENIDRENLKPHEIAQIIKRMANTGLEQRDIAKRLGRPQSWVSYHYKVATKLSSEGWKAFEDGKLTLEQALNIADIPEDEQETVIQGVVNADTRSEARKIAKTAAKESGKKREYSNKGKPSNKNVAKMISEASFDAMSDAYDDQEHMFFNGVVAGLKVALGDLSLDGLTANEDYADPDYHAKLSPPKKTTKPNKKKKVAKVRKTDGKASSKTKSLAVDSESDAADL